MSDHVYKQLELTGSSTVGIEDAVQTAIAKAAGHNEALRLMAQTMTAVLRERMMHVIPAHPRPDVFPLRRKVVHCLRGRDAEGAVGGALDELIKMLRRDSSERADGGVVFAPAES